MITKNNFYIITGGPGVGTTTLINELQTRKINCVPEVAREIIKDQMKNNGNALPWKDTKEYSKLMLSYSLRDFVEYLETDDLYFFDRGLPDTYGYERLMNFDYDVSKDTLLIAETRAKTPTALLLEISGHVNDSIEVSGVRLPGG